MPLTPVSRTGYRAAPYAAILPGNAWLQAAATGAYDLGRGEFTIMAWLQTAQPGGSGTVVARKGTMGGPGNGGFLLVVRADGTVKLATDDGLGYLETITVATPVGNGGWHHLAAVRQGGGQVVFLDGSPVPAVTTGSRPGPLDVDNPLPLTVGTTQQAQEKDRVFRGRLGTITLWRVACGRDQIAADLAGAPAGGPEVVGRWTFSGRDGTDSSASGNPLVPHGPVRFAVPGAPLGRGSTACPARPGRPSRPHRVPVGRMWSAP